MTIDIHAYLTNPVSSNSIPLNSLERGQKRMEKMRMRGVIVFFLVSLVIVQSTTAFDLGCYKDCLIPCLSHGVEGLIVCFITCKKKCSGGILSAPDNSNQQYCLLGCAATSCPQLNNNQAMITGSTLLLPFLKFFN